MRSREPAGQARRRDEDVSRCDREHFQYKRLTIQVRAQIEACGRTPEGYNQADFPSIPAFSMSSGPTSSLPQARPAKKISAGAVVAVVLLLGVALGLLAATSRMQSTNRDFVSYWAAARLLATHSNPYDAHAVLILENGVGNTFDRPLVLRNTPCTIFLMAPLGWFNVYTASMFWEAGMIGASLFSIWLLQPFIGGRVPLVAFFFAPIVDCFLAGQSTILVLLGIALFIRFEESRPFWAGTALLLTLLKPHLLLPFWAVLVLEIIRRREWRIVWGGVCATAAASLLATVLDPRIWTQYVVSVRLEHIENQYFPNIASTLRIWAAPGSLWPQLLPAVVGVVTAVWFWRRRRSEWQWPSHGAMVIAGSALVSPYSFLVDQVLFLPAVLYCYVRAGVAARIFFFVINFTAFYLMLKIPEMGSPVTLWVAPMMMIWCYVIYRYHHLDQAQGAPAAAAMLNS